MHDYTVDLHLALKHCVKSVQILIFSGPYFPVFSPKTGKYGREETPYLDTFHAVMFFVGRNQLEFMCLKSAVETEEQCVKLTAKTLERRRQN